MENIWTDIEVASARLAASYLASKKVELLGWVDNENDLAADGLLALIEKNEPSGIQMAIVKGALNKILSGLTADEKAAFPKSAAALIDLCVAKLTAVVDGKA